MTLGVERDERPDGGCGGGAEGVGGNEPNLGDVLALNDAFAIKIPDVDPEQLETVGQAFDIVADLAGVPAA